MTRKQKAQAIIDWFRTVIAPIVNGGFEKKPEKQEGGYRTGAMKKPVKNRMMRSG